MDKDDEVARDVCTDIIQGCVWQQSYRLKKAYWNKIKTLTPDQAYLLKPDNIEERSWKDLVNRWFDEHFQVHESYFFHIQQLNSYISTFWNTKFLLLIIGNVWAKSREPKRCEEESYYWI